ncbi:TetR/AcrR family transcriptional regulator [Oxalobacteraceae bacterium A2-2]
MRADAKKNYDRLLAVAQEAVTEHGADFSLRDVARRAEVGLGTLYRHFPTKEALLEALLRTSFEALAARAELLTSLKSSEEALVLWLEETIAFTYSHRGVLGLMMNAIEDPDSALHTSCVALRSAGTSLLERAQSEGKARKDVDGVELFALIAALAWIREQPSAAARSGHLFTVITDALLTAR